jgi:hypothetical protein
VRAGESRAPRRIGAQIKGEAGPPEGVPATRFLLLLDCAGWTSLVISFFESANCSATPTAPLGGGSPESPSAAPSR